MIVRIICRRRRKNCRNLTFLLKQYAWQAVLTGLEFGGKREYNKKIRKVKTEASRDACKNLEDRINWFTRGAPVSDTLLSSQEKRKKKKM